jgi:hypothetical protein
MQREHLDVVSTLTALRSYICITSEPQFPHLASGDNSNNHGTSGRFHKIMSMGLSTLNTEVAMI